VQETLGGIRFVKAFGQEDRERERFTGKASGSLRARIRLSFHEGGLGLMVALVIAVGEAAVVGGVDLRDYRIADMRNQFAIVLQDPVLFSTSLPEGYDTQLGVARAFLKDASVLILFFEDVGGLRLEWCQRWRTPAVLWTVKRPMTDP
jgi:hypothetical protein